MVYTALGEKDEAFRWLGRAFDEHSAPAYSFMFYPDFVPFAPIRALPICCGVLGLIRRRL